MSTANTQTDEQKSLAAIRRAVQLLKPEAKILHGLAEQFPESTKYNYGSYLTDLSKVVEAAGKTNAKLLTWALLETAITQNQRLGVTEAAKLLELI